MKSGSKKQLDKFYQQQLDKLWGKKKVRYDDDDKNDLPDEVPEKIDENFEIEYEMLAHESIHNRYGPTGILFYSGATW